MPLQEQVKPQEMKQAEDHSKVDDLRGSPLAVGTLEEIIDENHAIVSSSVGPEYYVGILSFVDRYAPLDSPVDCGLYGCGY